MSLPAAPVAAVPSPAPTGRRGRGGAGPIRLLLPTLPFFLFVGTFLVLPTAIVLITAFQGATGGLTLTNLSVLSQPAVRSAAFWSVGLSAVSALTGAVLGAVLAYALSTASRTGALRRTVVALCSVLAQFGGVMLAFAFIATFGATGSITTLVRTLFDVRLNTSWLYDFKGLLLVYAYFQIPLMVLVFLPALDGIRPQWREATQTLGGSTWVYWRRVAGPILAPAFLSATLLLFANAFSAYATAAALISQANPLLALQIRGFLAGEVVQDTTNSAQVVATLMVLIISVVMVLYAVLQRRTSRWLG